jgi:two-component system response regulator AtoC
MAEQQILIIDNDPVEKESLAEMVRRLDYRPIETHTLSEGLAAFQTFQPCLVLLSLAPEMEDLEIISKIREENSECPVIVLSSLGQVPNVVTAIKSGASNFLTKPVKFEELQAAIDGAQGAPPLSALPRSGGVNDRSRYSTDYEPLFLHSSQMMAIKDTVERVADTNATVLIRGESGVGKEIVARAIHYASNRHEKPLIKVNCAALPSELLESELFGHEKGAFTGAYNRKPGKFELAHTGTIFLDEIGDLPLELQAKLLHVLQDSEFSRLGGRELIRVNTRVIAATNKDLEAAVISRQFREDLYYRLNVVYIVVPPLRERREEIQILATLFLKKFNEQYNRQTALSADTMARLIEYHWPGNIRELENIIKRLVLLSNDTIILNELSRKSEARASKATGPPETSTSLETGSLLKPDNLDLKEIARQAAREAEREAIRRVLEQVHWNRTEAARLLKISYKALLYKIDQCGLSKKRTKAHLSELKSSSTS